MAIAYVGGQVAGRANPSSAVSVNFALTGGLAATPATGDIVVVAAVTGSAGGTPAMAIATPAGYTAIGQENQNSTGDTSMNVSWKIMNGTPDTSVTIPGTGNNAFAEAYSIQVFRGVDTGTPMDVAAVHTGGTGTGRPNPPSITPTTTGAAVVICGGGAAGTGANYTAPANYTTNFVTAAGADTTDAMVGSGYRLGMTGGVAEDPAVYTGGTTGATDSWAAYTLALRPIVAVTHATSGALAGPGSTVAGSASSKTTRPSSGVLVGQGSTVVGSAARTRQHPASGVLSGPGSAIVGSAARSVSHVTHATTGALGGPGSAVVGSASSATVRTSSGALVGQGAAIVGSASSATARPSSGALTGPGATIVGAAARTRAHVGSGVLAGPGATIAGSGAILRKHATSGALAAQGSAIAGAAARAAPGPVSHATSGALSGAGATVAGSASRAHLHAATGDLVASGATLSGAAARVHEHTSTGDLLADGSIVAGAAGRLGHGVVAHDASGSLVGGEAVISAIAYDLSPYRIFKIRAEDRVYLIPAEDSAWLLRGENRVYRV